MTGKNTSRLNEKEVKNSIYAAFGKQEQWFRKELIEYCLKNAGFTAEELKDRRPESSSTKAKTFVGMIISNLINDGHLYLSEGKKLGLAKDLEIIIKEENTEKYILHLLKCRRIMSKQEIFSAAEKYFGTDKTPSRADDISLRRTAGALLARLTREKILVKTAAGYSLPDFPGYPNSELGTWLFKAENGGNLEECFLRVVNLKGGEFLEYFSVKLLEKFFYSENKEVLRSEVTGGADDGGLDGVIETSDALGFKELILIQTKNRKSIAVTTKEVREFYGAMCAEKGTRGIFITTSYFHRDALKFLAKADNLVGIDGKKFFEIAKYCEMGLTEDKGRYRIDEKLFLN